MDLTKNLLTSEEDAILNSEDDEMLTSEDDVIVPPIDPGTMWRFESDKGNGHSTIVWFKLMFRIM